MSNASSAVSLFEPTAWKTTGSTKSSSQWEAAFANLFKGQLTRMSLFTDQGGDRLIQNHQTTRADQLEQCRSGGYEAVRDNTPLARLKQVLEQSGLGDADIVVQAEDRPLVEKILQKSGYDADTSKRIVDQASGTDGTISLKKVVAVAERLKPGEDDPPLLMSASYKPQLLQVLNQLGLSPAEVTEAMAKLKPQADQVDLKDLMQFLNTRTQGKAVVDQGALKALLQSLGLDANAQSRLVAEGLGADGTLSGAGLADILRRAGLLQAQKGGSAEPLLVQLAAKMKVKTSVGAGTEGDDRVLASIKAKLTVSPGDTKQLKLPFGLGENLVGGESGRLTGRQIEAMVQAGVKAPETTRVEGRGEAEAVTQSAGASNSAAQAKADPQGLMAGDIASAKATPVKGGGSSVMATYIVRQVADYMGPMVLKNQHQLTVTLKPPSLGELTVDVVLKDGHLQATVLTESFVVKHALEANLSDLKQQLAQQGVNIEQFNVEVRQQSAQGGTAGGGHGDRAGGGAGGSGGGEGEAVAVEADPAVTGAGWGGYVNLFA